LCYCWLHLNHRLRNKTYTLFGACSLVSCFPCHCNPGLSFRDSFFAADQSFVSVFGKHCFKVLALTTPNIYCVILDDPQFLAEPTQEALMVTSDKESSNILIKHSGQGIPRWLVVHQQVGSSARTVAKQSLVLPPPDKPLINRRACLPPNPKDLRY